MLLEEQIVGVRPVDAADLVDVAEALGDEQRGLGAGALQDRVDGDGRAVQEQADGGIVGPGLGDAGIDALDQMLRRRQRLAETQLPVVSSKTAMSVKVPPISAARRTGEACRRAGVWREGCIGAGADERTSRRHPARVRPYLDFGTGARGDARAQVERDGAGVPRLVSSCFSSDRKITIAFMPWLRV